MAGFSGTNDDLIIMPTTLKWIDQEDLSLVGTDGKMIHLLQKAHFAPLTTSKMNQGGDKNDEEIGWSDILDFVVYEVKSETDNHRTCALIDAGALMAGAPSNREVALYIARRLNTGVIFFDIDLNGWWVLDSFGRSWPKHSSPIHERDGFVYFDESRTRGADMRLNSNARAVLTLGPDMCKDKLMQAAGRMRMLAHGQTLLLAAGIDVTSKVHFFVLLTFTR